jgi:hypothetical protein
VAGGDKDDLAKILQAGLGLRDPTARPYALYVGTLSAARRTEPQNKPVDGS